MPREYSAAEKRNIENANRMFAPPHGFDVSSLFAEDAVWWNGHPKLRGDGSCEHKGIEAIRKILNSAGTDTSRFGVDAYDP